MHPRLLSLVGISGHTAAVYSAFAFALALVLAVVKWFWTSKLDAIPTAGSSTWLGSWWAGLKYLTNALDVLQEGYEKYKRAPFKVAVFHRWVVVLSSREHVEELRRSPDGVLSCSEGVNDQLQIEYTWALTRNIGALYPEIRNEIIAAFDDVLDLRGHEWKNVFAWNTVQNVICRMSSRAFVGFPLCRDPDWIDLSLKFTRYVVTGAMIIKLFPTPLKPLAARLFTNVVHSNERGRKHLAPLIEERRQHLNKHGDQWADRPNDLLSWLLEEAEGPESSVEALTARILACIFAAIQTSSTAFTNALFYLATNPQYIQPLREEVEGIVEEEGWTKAAVDKMRNIDSFLRESERMQGISGLSLVRKALKDFAFSDGTPVPKGTIVAAASRCIQYDETFYPNAHTFEPFRFADMRQEDGEGAKCQYVSTAPEYLPFGYGRHACPGRSFAANELKSMLAHVVVTYDIKLSDNTMVRPQTLHIGTAMMPDPKVKVIFRRRGPG